MAPSLLLTDPLIPFGFGQQRSQCRAIEGTNAVFQRLQLTASAGVVTYGRDRSTSMMELLVEADAALYEAKATGRNRWVLAPH